MAIVAEGIRERVYLNPSHEQEDIAKNAQPFWKPDVEFFQQALGFRVGNYGMTRWSDLFTDRQLVALATFSDIVQETQARVWEDASSAGYSNDETPLFNGGVGAAAYRDSVVMYLSFSVSKALDRNTTLCTWEHRMDRMGHTFQRQCLPMTWDYVETNPIGGAGGDIYGTAHSLCEVLDKLFEKPSQGTAAQFDAQSQDLSNFRIVSTDPPYYDNIGYADLSDFFYVWLRRSLRAVFPDLFATLTVPKAEELVATAYRHGGKDNAEDFFLCGMTQAMQRIAEQSHPAFPVTIYYAFKQSEMKTAAGTASTGWETFLAAVINAGFALDGTWPIRTELANRMRGMDSNALATSVVLVCHRRLDSALTLSRNEFRRQLRQELPRALKELERANIAPVDLAQAAIGPGMAIYSSAKAVLNPDDSPMSVREALIEINAALDDYLSQQEGDLDADSRFALTFFESFGYTERDFGDAEGLAKARNVSVAGVAQSGILRAVAGKAWLLRREQLDVDWDPSRDERLCVWEATQHLIRRLEEGGEANAAELLAQLRALPGHGELADNCRALAYRLYNHCEKTKQAEEARAYNGLVIAWPELERLAAAQGIETAVQASLI
ncbi:DUF1156 domain-containing protein [Cyanobium sp. NIES-981]|uniref:DUF1156 domain-containing protein n=1 Tax=Cyanobium sp. NIES-981 TaxID=1851505 RepID=UPI0007DD21F8|nr:DUF1156 domain-containing protein [Cyanobium sp. NIES-981]SBO44247.1 conserved protein of unknown function [Cyanobium sp. NIES-981]